ncbi:hypothetical protein HBZS_107950 [Helicobacter bizzozeronii CCUG 35545]|nr:hypothetical protein HBZS_107950 [Helicobacter bizzozeronii CCUG 35545]
MVGKRGILVLGVFFTILYLLDIRGSSSYLSDKIKVFFLNTKDYFVVGYQKHFQQAKMIEDYQQQLQGYRDLKLAYADLISKNKALIATIGDLENLQKTYAPNTSNLSALLANKNQKPPCLPNPPRVSPAPLCAFHAHTGLWLCQVGRYPPVTLRCQSLLPQRSDFGHGGI